MSTMQEFADIVAACFEKIAKTERATLQRVVDLEKNQHEIVKLLTMLADRVQFYPEVPNGYPNS